MQARGAKILLLNCTPALCPMYERIGFVRYKPAYCDVGGMGLQVTPTLGSGRDGEHRLDAVRR